MYVLHNIKCSKFFILIPFDTGHNPLKNSAHIVKNVLQAQFVRAEKHVKELNLSVDLMKNESRKLLERAALAEKDMRHGQSELM